MTDETDNQEVESIETLDAVFEDDQATSEDVQGEPQEEANAEPEQDSEPPAEKDQKTVPIAALLDERRKAKAYQEELEKLRAQVKPADESDAPDPAEDPKAYKEWVRVQVAKEDLETRVNTSRSAMLETHDDYETMEKVFIFLASQDPELVKQMNSHPEPAKFAYDKAKEHRNAEREAIRAELLAEGKIPEPSKEDIRKKSAVGLPDLTKATAQGSNSMPVPTLPELKDMFKDSPF